MKHWSTAFCVLTLAAVLALAASFVAGQATPDVHSPHHPKEGSPAPSPTAAASSRSENASSPSSEMNSGMGDMMEGMHAAPPKELFPSLMDLPELSPERRAEVERLARERIETSRAQMSAATEQLSAASARNDYAEMQKATAQLREATAIFESGLAAQRALAEGQAPRNVALQWFKREMNLGSPIPPEEPRTILGVTPLHLFTMVLLIAFALAVVAMYFFKMRRAAALFGRLDSDPNRPPPGASPPLSGAPGPSPPVAPTPRGTSRSAAPPSVPGSTSVAPMTANWRGQLRVASIVSETPSVKTLRLVSAFNDRFIPFTFVPGQFLNVSFWIGGARMNRSYSISSSPMQREYVELTVRREPRGAVSRHIDDLLKVGDEIEAAGPVGRFTFSGTEADSIVLIAGGVGITPMMSITRYLTERSWAGDIFFIYACRAPTDFIFAKEIAALQLANPKLHVTVVMSRVEGTDWTGPRGHITTELLSQIPDLPSRRIHLCGPPPMMDAIKAILTELGVPADHVKTELFGTPKPIPASPGTTAIAMLPATGPLVTFSRNNKTAKIHVDQTILELSEELNIGIEFSCRVGTCGVCKVKMTSGEVEMPVEDALDFDDKLNGIILACQAKPTIDVVVEA